MLEEATDYGADLAVCLVGGPERADEDDRAFLAWPQLADPGQPDTASARNRVPDAYPGPGAPLLSVVDIGWRQLWAGVSETTS